MARRKGFDAMDMTGARDRFAALASRPDDRIDVAEGALLIAQEEYPQIEIGAYLRRLDELALAARSRVQASVPAAEQIAQLNAFLFVERGFAGNSDNFYDPRNSYLNEVLDRRTGIPISLSLVYSEVAQRLDLPVYGVSFPGHFLVKHVGDPEIIIDPFFGIIITQEECAHRLQAIYRSKAHFEPRLLHPAGAREILARMLSNLKQIYVDAADFDHALACVDRILLLDPDQPRELRDRGILYQRLECYAAALRDFNRYLKLAPDDEAAALIRKTLPDLQRQAAMLQ